MIDIDRLEAGPEMDALVAEKVMLWTCKDGRYYDGQGNATEFWADGYAERNGDPTIFEWHPSTKLAAAFWVVQHLGRSGYITEISGPYDQVGSEWRAFVRGRGFSEHDRSFGLLVTHAPKLEEAICRAALRGVGYTHY